MGYWMNKVPKCRQNLDALSVPHPRHRILRLIAASGPRGVYWESMNGEMRGPAEVTAEAHEGSARWVCVESPGSIAWIRHEMLRSHPTLRAQGYERGCYSCRSIHFWASIHGAVICGACHPPAHDALVAYWLDCLEPAYVGESQPAEGVQVVEVH